MKPMERIQPKQPIEPIEPIEAPMPMNTEPNLADPDAFYEVLLDAHRGLSEAQSAQLNARLVLLLANQVGDAQVLAQCVHAAAALPRGAEEVR
jgi:hypothetical protein